MTSTERDAFVRAVLTLKNTGKYDPYVNDHVVRFPQIHSTPLFLPWHREFLHRFEADLRAVNADVTIPYWDWTTDRSTESTLWSSNFMGGDGDPLDNDLVKTGPFAGWGLTRTLGASSSLPGPEGVRDVSKTTPYSAYSPSFEHQVHDRPHVWVGGTMVSAASPSDPVFWLHHCNVDRLWVRWQRDHPNLNYEPVSGGPPGQNLTDSMPPWTTRPADVLDHTALGYSYDTDSIPGDYVQANGRLTLLRVHRRGSKYGPPRDRIDAEVIIWLDSEPGKAFGLPLRADEEEEAHSGVLKILRDTFAQGRRIQIDYVHTGTCHHLIARVMRID